jgi:hypothetical protein
MSRLDDLVSHLKTHRFYGSDFVAHVNATIEELVNVVMSSEGTGVPSRGQARLMFWLEKCKSEGYLVQEKKHGVGPDADADDAEPVVRASHSSHSIDRDNYPADPYRTPPFKASVHMPNGSIERWGPTRLRAAGGMIGNSLPWDTRYGAQMHYNPATGRIHTVEGPGFRRDAYDAWAQSY